MEEMYKHLEALLQREFDTNETLKVLQTPINIYWCWGVQRYGRIDHKGLLLKVNGYLHNDYVLITLGWDDTYIVTLLDKMLQVIGEPHKGIYVDMLQYTVDRLVETNS